ncbi:MAG: DctP family TRAP transporter solute-binding subunit [Betaproteobacteria bacterium]|nr:DctP family TRAP transporter solute-binding subunit [Betaproteobacteria bacterium]NBT66751.1 DctP family TRAP transporter solute-binding subunit [Betaproteobacteria bacterium]NBY08449.1 DctP family TRAP transporter solute-binding subunit [Betaproteobacteria bacterium]
MKKWMKQLSVTLVATGALIAGSVQAADPILIGIGYPTPLVGPHGAGAKGFEEELNRLAPGRFKVQHFPGGSLGGEREMVESLQLGTLQMSITGTAIIGNFVPEMMVMDIPFLFRDSAHARNTLDGQIGKDLLNKFNQKNLVGLTFGEIGFRHITDNKKAIKSADDLRGLKIRTMENPVHLAAFRALGAQPTPMAWTEVMTALQQGTIDGQENPISIIVSTKLWQTQKYMTLSRHVFTPIAFTMSGAFFTKLSPSDQDIVRKAAINGRTTNRQYIDQVEKSGLDEIRKNGMQITTEIDTADFQKKLEPVYKQYGEKFADLITSIKNTK